jgi:hypothetical protein
MSLLAPDIAETPYNLAAKSISGIGDSSNISWFWNKRGSLLLSPYLQVRPFMRAVGLAVVALATMAVISPTFALPSDEQIRQLLVGYWTTPADNADPLKGAGAQEPRTLERYNADGTGVVFIYSDMLCGKLQFTGTFNWSLRQGIMLTTIPTGARSTDQFVSIDDEAFAVRFIGGGRSREFIAHRIRANACPNLR